MLKSFIFEEDGLEMIEYAVIGGLITATVAAAVALMGTNAETIYSEIADNMN